MNAYAIVKRNCRLTSISAGMRRGTAVPKPGCRQSQISRFGIARLRDVINPHHNSSPTLLDGERRVLPTRARTNRNAACLLPIAHHALFTNDSHRACPPMQERSAASRNCGLASCCEPEGLGAHKIRASLRIEEHAAVLSPKGNSPKDDLLPVRCPDDGSPLVEVEGTNMDGCVDCGKWFLVRDDGTIVEVV